MIKDILKKARRYVPFVWEASTVDFGGEACLYEDEPEVTTIKYNDGWQESGTLILDSNGDKIGYPPEEGVFYILRYNVIHTEDMKDEMASVFIAVNKPKDPVRVGVVIREETEKYSKNFTDFILEWLAVDRRLKISPTDNIELGERLYMIEGNPDDVMAGVTYLQEIFK